MDHSRLKNTFKIILWSLFFQHFAKILQGLHVLLLIWKWDNWASQSQWFAPKWCCQDCDPDLQISSQLRFPLTMQWKATETHEWNTCFFSYYGSWSKKKIKILSILNMKSNEDLFNVSLLSHHHLVITSLTVSPQFTPSMNMWKTYEFSEIRMAACPLAKQIFK